MPTVRAARFLAGLFLLLLGLPAPAVAQPDGRAWGVVTTTAGLRHEGFLRWDDGTAGWSDRLSGRVVPGDGGLNPARGRSVDFLGVRISWDDDEDPDGERRATIALADVRAVEIDTAGRVHVQTRQGTRLTLRGPPQGIEVEGADGAVVRVAADEQRRVDLAAAPDGWPAPRRRLWAEVEDRWGGVWSGALTWRGGESLAGDVIAGEGLPLASLRTVERRAGDGVVATTRSGVEHVLRDPPDEGAATGTLRIADPAVGVVGVPWRDVRRVRFLDTAPSGGAAPGVDGAGPATAEGVTGWIRGREGTWWVGAVSWGGMPLAPWAYLEGRWRRVEIQVALRVIERVERTATGRARLHLRGGKTLELRGGDFAGTRGRIEVDGGAGAPQALRWSAVAEVAFTPPAQTPVAAPAGPPPTYLDPTAAALHRAASERWNALDESVTGYTAVVQQRMAATLRTPLRDRTLYRNESVARVAWERDREPLVQVLGARARYPGREQDVQERGGEAILDAFTIDGAFDPGGDRLVFGTGSGDVDGAETDRTFQITHPLGPAAGADYGFRSGDTLVVTLPDGRELQAIRLDVLPQVADSRLLAATLWIDPASGAVVRAAYRLARKFDALRDVPELREEDEAGAFRRVPGLLKPWTFEMEVMVVDYAYWHFRAWLPRSVRFEGVAAAGIFTFPVSYDLAYDFESVTFDEPLADPAEAPPEGEARHFATRSEALRYMAELAGGRSPAAGVEPAAPEWVVDEGGRLVPADLGSLETSAALPPPIHQSAPGFISSSELRAAIDELADLPRPPPPAAGWLAAWGTGRAGLLRYNRVEGPALGGRVEVETGSFVGPVTWSAVGFLGLADREPKARLSAERATFHRTVTVAAFRELRPLDDGGRHLGAGHSLGALLFGRDDGEYFRATGVDLEIGPPPTRRAGWQLRLFAERQEPVERRTDFALPRAFDSGWQFRPVLPADRVDEAGGELRIAPWWGRDADAPQLGAELRLRGARGRRVHGDDYGYLGGSLVLRTIVPVVRGRWYVGAEAGGGAIGGGDVPLQRHWIAGGARTLRGFDASTTVGRRLLRGRLEIGRRHPAAAFTLFGDVVATRGRPAWDPEGVGRWMPDPDRWNHNGARWGVGVGVSLLDGLIRLDLSRGVSGPDPRSRLDLHLDAVF